MLSFGNAELRLQLRTVLRDDIQARKEQDYIDLFVSFKRGKLREVEQISMCPIRSPKWLLPPWKERAAPTFVWPNSVLDRLRSVSKNLARVMHWWKEYEAVWFILTGSAPFVSPLEAEIQFGSGAKIRGVQENPVPLVGHPYLDERFIEQSLCPSTATITLRVEPWVPAESVKRIYRSVQKELIGNSKPPWERNLRVYTFVKQQRSEGADDSRLPALWNETARKEWHYRSAHGFWQAYKAARRQVEEAVYNALEHP